MNKTVEEMESSYQLQNALWFTIIVIYSALKCALWCTDIELIWVTITRRCDVGVRYWKGTFTPTEIQLPDGVPLRGTRAGTLGLPGDGTVTSRGENGDSPRGWGKELRWGEQCPTPSSLVYSGTLCCGYGILPRKFILLSYFDFCFQIYHDNVSIFLPFSYQRIIQVSRGFYCC